MNYDKILDKIFFKDNKYYLNTVVKYNRNKHKKYINISLYIKNRFCDSRTDRETLYRIHYNIDNIPLCPICGKELKFYGKSNLIYSSHCSHKCKKLDKNVNKKWKETCGEKGTNRKKAQQTMIKKYGYDNAFKIPENISKIQKRNKEIFPQTLEKMKKTSYQKYGVDYVFQSEEIKEKIKQSSLNKYGVSHPMKSNIVKEKYDWTKIIKKIYNAKRKNNTFKTSQSEEKSYKLLKEKYPDVIRQYKSDVYPFACDFYIPSLDLYIECNYHWTHGGKPFEANEKDNVIIEGWKEKGTKYYVNAINTWTNLDVRKRTIAKENKLNYLEFFTFDMFKNWL